MQSIAGRILNYLFYAEAAAAILLYAMIAALLACDVLLREVGVSFILGVQRMCVYAMIQTGFLGLGLAAARGRHLRPRFADALVPKRFVPLVRRIGSFSMAAIFGYFIIFGVKFVMEAIEYGDLARTIKIPLWIVQLVVPYAFFSTALRYLIYGIFPDLNPEEKVE